MLAVACGLSCTGPTLAQSTTSPAAKAATPYLYDQFSPGEGATSAIDDLIEIDRPEIPITDTTTFDTPFAFARRQFDALNDKTGLRLGIAFTALGAQASGGGDPGGAAGDFDLVSAWTLLGRGTPNTGILVASVEYRSAYTDQPPSAMGAELGTLINVVNAFNDRGAVVRDFYWLQRLYEGKLRILFGRADLGEFFGLQPMQNVNALFVNRHFSGNPTVTSPGHGPTVDFAFRPNDRFYVSGGVANAYNNTQESGFDSIDQGDFFYTAEAGFTPLIEGMGRGRYSVMGWHIDERTRDTIIPSDQGITLVAGQELSDRFQVWARYAYAQGTTTNVRELAQAGLGYTGLFGSPSNMTGFAFSFAKPRSDQSREEKVIEVFERFQVSRFTQISIGAQAVFDPGNNPDANVLGVFYARLRLAF